MTQTQTESSLGEPICKIHSTQMGRPEPYVLFSQTFNHPHLDEYVDEVQPSLSLCEFRLL